LKKKAFRPKKRFGQHFLYDPAIANRIVDAADLSSGQVVVELGAGKGILTKPLVQRGARLIAVEVDRDLHAELGRSLAPTGEAGGGRVELLHEDFTKLSITGMLVSRGLDRCTLFGNIPYNLTREVLFSYLVDEYEMVDAAYLMLQREVGERIVSSPGSRVYGITSVVLQSLYAVRVLFRVAPGSFFPRPKVGSVVLEFKPLEAPLVKAAEFRPFMALVKNVFQQRRKTIHNTIKRFYSLTETELKKIQEASGVELDKRPEELDTGQFVRLSRVVSDINMAEHE
jgi:16S rRNA (adenine1518-N6/adenine1519-N6)-dimethyltransferase